MRKYVILAIIAALIGGFFWLRSGNGNNRPQILDTVTVQRGEVRKILEATGIVQAQVGAIVKIGARATGTIDRMLVKVGDPVKKGDLIAVIDSRELSAQRAEERAGLAKLKSELARIEKIYPLQIQEAEAELAVAEAEAEYARANLARQEKLHAQDLIAEDTLDNARKDAEVKINRAAAAEVALVRLKAEYLSEARKTKDSIREAEANIESIDIRISYTRIISPIDGVVSQVTAQEGETIVAGLQVANLITVLDPNRLEMWIYVNETDVGQVKPGQKVEFRVDAYPDRMFEGQVNQIYPQPEIRDNIVYYQALVDISPEQAALLRPEMTTHCSIVVQVKDDVVALPNQALKWVNGEQVVFVQDKNGQVKTVKPELGLAGLNNSEVLSGINPGDEVATQVVLPQSKSGGGR